MISTPYATELGRAPEAPILSPAGGKLREKLPSNSGGFEKTPRQKFLLVERRATS
jgi:hypothetical protein